MTGPPFSESRRSNQCRIRRWIEWSIRNDRIFKIGGEITNKLKMSISICCYISSHRRRIEKPTTRFDPRHVNWSICIQQSIDAIVCSDFLTDVIVFCVAPQLLGRHCLFRVLREIFCARSHRARSSLGGCASWSRVSRFLAVPIRKC